MATIEAFGFIRVGKVASSVGQVVILFLVCDWLVVLGKFRTLDVISPLVELKLMLL